jgi:hypothetical protein
MKPDQVVKKLLLIASKIQASSNPSRELVVNDLRKILSSFDQNSHGNPRIEPSEDDETTEYEPGMLDIQDHISNPNSLSGLSPDEKITMIQSPEFQTSLREDMGLGSREFLKYNKVIEHFLSKGFDEPTASFYAMWSADDFEGD